jgi:hypothetical protein
MEVITITGVFLLYKRSDEVYFHTDLDGVRVGGKCMHAHKEMPTTEYEIVETAYSLYFLSSASMQSGQAKSIIYGIHFLHKTTLSYNT